MKKYYDLLGEIESATEYWKARISGLIERTQWVLEELCGVARAASAAVHVGINENANGKYVLAIGPSRRTRLTGWVAKVGIADWYPSYVAADPMAQDTEFVIVPKNDPYNPLGVPPGIYRLVCQYKRPWCKTEKHVLMSLHSSREWPIREKDREYLDQLPHPHPRETGALGSIPKADWVCVAKATPGLIRKLAEETQGRATKTKEAVAIIEVVAAAIESFKGR